jgi:membrane protease YdiL (CAAX protease family)
LYFTGVLWHNLLVPAGGALSVFLLGLLFGLVAHKSRSIAATMLTHAINNAFSA